MFIGACLECYDGEKGAIVKVTKIDPDDPVCLKCGKPNYLVFTNRQAYGGCNGDYKLTSAALAISPSQIRAHKKLHPSVGVLPDGQLQFTSFRSHDEYLKKTGFVKHTQKRKVKGKIIA